MADDTTPDRKLLLPGSADADLRAEVLEEREMRFNFGSKRVHVGDGVTLGGIPFASGDEVDEALEDGKTAVTALVQAAASSVSDAKEAAEKARQDAIAVGRTIQKSNNGAVVLAQTDGRSSVFNYADDAGEQYFTNMPFGQSLQKTLRRPEPRFMQGDFKPFQKPRLMSERWNWSGLSRDARFTPVDDDVTAYVFRWPPDPVPASQVRRARGKVGSNQWQLDEITVNEGGCPGFFESHQFRDLSVMRDRLTGTTWILVNAISVVGYGWCGTRFALAKTTDGVNITLVGYVELPLTVLQTWSPEWFVAPNGELHVIVSANSYMQNFTSGDLLDSLWGYHILRCVDLDTASFDYLGEIDGSAFPRMTSGKHIGEKSMIDPALFYRDGAYYTLWKAETAKDVSAFSINFGGAIVPYGTLGWAASAELMGPYNNGNAFYLPNGQPIQGEGPYYNELPEGNEFLHRIGFDDFKNLYGGGACYADTNDFIDFPAGVKSLDGSTADARGSLGDYNRHATFVIGLNR